MIFCCFSLTIFFYSIRYVGPFRRLFDVFACCLALTIFLCSSICCDGPVVEVVPWFVFDYSNMRLYSSFIVIFVCCVSFWGCAYAVRYLYSLRMMGHSGRLFHDFSVVYLWRCAFTVPVGVMDRFRRLFRDFCLFVFDDVLSQYSLVWWTISGGCFIICVCCLSLTVCFCSTIAISTVMDHSGRLFHDFCMLSTFDGVLVQ